VLSHCLKRRKPVIIVSAGGFLDVKARAWAAVRVSMVDELKSLHAIDITVITSPTILALVKSPFLTPFVKILLFSSSGGFLMVRFHLAISE
jgi:hypothetical protein